MTRQLDATFGALADRTRRDMIRSLLHKPRRAGELAELVSMSPQALSRHLRVLRKAGLVLEEGIDADARVRIYSIHPEAFAPVREWMAEVEDAWKRQLQAFKSYAEQTQRTRRSRT
jgi:DNA-binding transcriptional ArsR family regulator